jgi:predicted ATP-dependent endonuclease of OLD family
MIKIQKIKLVNFKRFSVFQLEFDDRLNILVGDNESGKSSILTALDIVLSGSRTKIETLGLDSLFNIEAINSFLKSGKEYVKLPILSVELYLNEQNNLKLNGKDNSDGKGCDGLQLICEPNDLLSKEIKDILQQKEPNFPFEYYTISFRTFSGESYTGYSNFVKHLLLDNSQINAEYATREYVKTLYSSNVIDSEKNRHQNEYRKAKDNFKNEILIDLNKRVDKYSFTIRSNSKSNLENDLTIAENDINIENKGKGRQCFIKTDFALTKKTKNKDIDILLIEEPENHLSHINMKKLINRIIESVKNEEKQLFITTHNDLISSRLDLRKTILLNSNSSTSLKLTGLKEKTAEFFIKAPNNRILELILSKKVILVEGDAEFILLESFFENHTQKLLSDSDVHIISVGGTSFKRFLDISTILNIKTVVIRDNDSDFQTYCIDRYSDYNDNPQINICFDKDNTRRTFEISLYEENKELVESLFGPKRKGLSIQDYMLKNKTEAALELLIQTQQNISIPDYIKEAIEWIIN